MQMGWLGLSDDGKPKKPCVLPRMEGTFPFHSRRAQAAPAQAPALQSGVRGEGPGSTVMHSKAGLSHVRPCSEASFRETNPNHFLMALNLLCKKV